MQVVIIVHLCCSNSLSSYQFHIREGSNQLSNISTNPAMLMNNSSQRINLQSSCERSSHFRWY